MRNEGAQFLFQHLVNGHVQARIGGVPDGSCAKAGEEAPDACLVVNIFDGDPHGRVGIKSRLKPDLDDGQRHQHKACPCPCHSASHHVGRIGQLRQRRRRGAVGMDLLVEGIRPLDELADAMQR